MLPSAEADFKVKILRILQDEYNEMASRVEMPLNNSPASDSRSMNNMDHWKDTDSWMLRLQGWLHTTVNGLGIARLKAHPVGLATETHIVLQSSERYLSMKQVDRKFFVHCWKVQSFFLFFFVRYPLYCGWEENRTYMNSKMEILFFLKTKNSSIRLNICIIWTIFKCFSVSVHYNYNKHWCLAHHNNNCILKMHFSKWSTG